MYGRLVLILYNQFNVVHVYSFLEALLCMALLLEGYHSGNSDFNWSLKTYFFQDL